MRIDFQEFLGQIYKFFNSISSKKKPFTLAFTSENFKFNDLKFFILIFKFNLIIFFFRLIKGVSRNMD